jgi:hypothetical protein
MTLNMNIPVGTVIKLRNDNWTLTEEAGCYIFANTRTTDRRIILNKELGNMDFVELLRSKLSIKITSVKEVIDLEAPYETTDVFYMLYHDENARQKDTIITLDTGTLKQYKLSTLLNHIAIRMDVKIYKI